LQKTLRESSARTEADNCIYYAYNACSTDKVNGRDVMTKDMSSLTTTMTLLMLMMILRMNIMTLTKVLSIAMTVMILTMMLTMMMTIMTMMTTMMEWLLMTQMMMEKFHQWHGMCPCAFQKAATAPPTTLN
jgi:hypothetical protein